MHIPDGYLSPSTCAVLYAGAGAGWYGALRRIRRTLNARMVPLISVFAAFSFVLMMFNLPLPGGTTGHALGVTVAAIVLGPAGAILSISIAIVIQALFFGDGGITTLGANCFNMAIVGSLVAYATYRLIASGAAITSRRRLFASAVAGYLATNAAAFIAALEFGIQPLLFHDPRGVPLYAPYSLTVAIPAMMIGHLAVAGVAEAAISAGLVAYLQVADPALLQSTSGLAPDIAAAQQPATQKSLRKLVDDRGAAPLADALGHSRRWYRVGRMGCGGVLQCDGARPNRGSLARPARSFAASDGLAAAHDDLDCAHSGLRSAHC